MTLAGTLGFAQAPATPVLSLTATTENVSGAHDPVRIDVLRWSTDAERNALLAGWNMTAAPAPAARGGGRGGGGGGRGRGGGAPVDVPKPTPETSLAAALEKAPTIGYLWSSEVAGYALRYAAKSADPAGGERIVFITDRRLGLNNDRWNLAGGAAPQTADFSIIEIHLPAKLDGEGKTSLLGKPAIDTTAKTFGLENYASLPVNLKGVKKK
jgi:hypothetical protein